MNNQEQFKAKIGKFDLVCIHENNSIKFRAECLHEGNILESTFSNDSLPLECKIFFSQSIQKLYNFIKDKSSTKLKMQNDELHIMFDLMGQKKNITLPLQKGQADLKSLLNQIQKLNKTVQGLKDQKLTLTKQLENVKHQFAAYRASQLVQQSKVHQENASLKNKNKVLQKQLDNAFQKEKKLKNQLQQRQKEIRDQKEIQKKQKTSNKKKQKENKKAQKQKKKEQKFSQKQIQQSIAKEQQKKQSKNLGFQSFLTMFNRPIYQQPRQYVYTYHPQSEQQVQVDDQSSEESQQQFDSQEYEEQYQQTTKKKANQKSKKKQKLAMDLVKDQFIIKWNRKGDIIQKIANLSRYPDCLTIKIKGTQSQNANQGIKELTQILQNDVSLKHIFVLNIFFDNIPFTKGVDHLAWDLLREGIIQHGEIKYINLIIGSKTWSANQKQLSKQMQVYPKNLILTLYVETWQ